MGSRFAPSVSRSTPWFAPGYGQPVRGPLLHESRLDLARQPLDGGAVRQPPRRAGAASRPPSPRRWPAGTRARVSATARAARTGATPTRNRSPSTRRHRSSSARRRSAVRSAAHRSADSLQQPRSEPADDLLVERRAGTRDQHPRARSALPRSRSAASSRARTIAIDGRRRTRPSARSVRRRCSPAPRSRAAPRTAGRARSRRGGSFARSPRRSATAQGRRGEGRVERRGRAGLLVAVERGAQRRHGLDLAGAAHDHENLNGRAEIATRRFQTGYDESRSARHGRFVAASLNRSARHVLRRRPHRRCRDARTDIEWPVIGARPQRVRTRRRPRQRRSRTA